MSERGRICKGHHWILLLLRDLLLHSYSLQGGSPGRCTGLPPAWGLEHGRSCEELFLPFWPRVVAQDFPWGSSIISQKLVPMNFILLEDYGRSVKSNSDEGTKWGGTFGFLVSTSFRKWYVSRYIIGKIAESGIIVVYIQQKFLHWFLAISLTTLSPEVAQQIAAIMSHHAL